MSLQNQNQNGYMLLFRGNDWIKPLSPEEKQKVTDQWMAWFKRLTEQGKAVAGNPLEREGKVVSGKNRLVSDGPFAESNCEGVPWLALRRRGRSQTGGGRMSSGQRIQAGSRVRRDLSEASDRQAQDRQSEAPYVPSLSREPCIHRRWHDVRRRSGHVRIQQVLQEQQTNKDRGQPK